jgi:hypothetical protein
VKTSDFEREEHPRCQAGLPSAPILPFPCDHFSGSGLGPQIAHCTNFMVVKCSPILPFPEKQLHMVTWLCQVPWEMSELFNSLSLPQTPPMPPAQNLLLNRCLQWLVVHSIHLSPHRQHHPTHITAPLSVIGISTSGC